MSADARPFVIGIPAYPGVDLMDVAAPLEIFSWMAEKWKERAVTVWLLAEDGCPVTTRDGLQITPHRTFAQAPALDLLWVPGGDPKALTEQMANEVYLDQLRAWSQGAAYVTSVCEGALLLAAAGLLDGYRVTTHWAFLPCLRDKARFPGIREVIGGQGDFPRFVVDPGVDVSPRQAVRVTGGGISSGLDEALKLVEMIAGHEIAIGVQQVTQYLPDPPVHATLPDATGCPV